MYAHHRFVLLRLLCALAVAGSAAAQEKWTYPPIAPGFGWKMPPRYGLDRNGDGIFDLPNSRSYVYNTTDWSEAGCPCVGGNCETGAPQFRVDFTPRATFPPMPAPRAHAQPGPASQGTSVPGQRELEARIQEAKDEAARVAAYALEMQKRKFYWTFEGPAGNFRATTAGVSTPHSQCLPLGKYTVTLQAAYEKHVESHTESVHVEDLLIVQLGDSFASGEGAPEARLASSISVAPPYNNQHYTSAARQLVDALNLPEATHVLWADDGRPYSTQVSESTRLLVLGSTPTRVTIRLAHPRYEEFSEEHRRHYRAHRSSFAAGSQFALQVEQERRGSVTFVNLAASGARTDVGLMASYEGVRKERFFDPAVQLPGQLVQLKDLVGARKIDVLLISIGGNDAGFANALAALIAHENEPAPEVFGRAYLNLYEIETAVKSGKWADIENQMGPFAFVFSWSNILGMDSLQHQYQLMKETMQTLELDVAQVYVSHYPQLGKNLVPDVTVAMPGAFADVEIEGGLRYCDYVLDAVAPKTAWGMIDADSEISRGELKWATAHLLSPLNALLSTAAGQNGWTAVDGMVTLSEPHGLCADAPYAPQTYSPSHPVALRSDSIRYFRRGQEGGALQNKKPHESTLVAHPNEFGYRAMAQRLKEVVALPDED